MGYGAYYTCLYKNNFQHVCVSTPINRLTMSHIVGVPNHIRCWKTSFYHSIGGHNHHLPVADDYELIVRTVIASTCWVRISEMCYIQYRNRNGNNFTFIRNQLIQDLVRIISLKYSDQLDAKFQKLLQDNDAKLEFLSKPIFKYDQFKMPIFDKTFSPKNEMFSIILPTYNRPEHLLKAIQSVINQTYSNWTLYIIGDKCPILNKIMDLLRLQTKFDERIRWWNLSENNGAGGAVPRNYGLYLAYTEWIAYLDDDNTWDPDHLQSFVDIIKKNGNVSYLFSSFKIDGTELITDVPVKGSLDTSCIVHKRDLIFKYGLWKDRIQAGYAHDYEFFSRWKNEKWIPTKKATMNYSTEFNPQSFDSIKQLYLHHQKLYHQNSII
jgi:hypothetical protein